MVKRILLVEDNLDLQEFIKNLLQENDFSVHVVSNGLSGLKVVEKSPPELVILDLGLPDVSGETVCQEIRKKYPDLPIVILTAKDTLADKVQGLSLGADDYISKPFAGEELVARVKARLRNQEAPNSRIEVGDLILDQKTFEVKRAQRNIKLTPKEFKLLEYLMSNRGRILTREMILNRIWLYSPDIDTRAVDVYIGYLRKKIDAGHDKKLIHSVRGYGYMVKA